MRNLVNKIKKVFSKLKSYFKHLLFPLYLFPIKLFTYSIYYVMKFIFGLIFGFLGMIFDTIKYPFKSFKNFWKSVIGIIVICYLFVSLFVITDYLTKQYGYVGKFLCSYGTKERLINSVVRIEGASLEGSGFFISPNEVMTNFHVINGEPSPKIIFPDGTFTTPTNLVGDKDADLAVLTTQANYPKLVLPIMQKISFANDEPLIATGYALGTDILGEATVLRGNFVSYRANKNLPTNYIQTSISLVSGMSGGPLTDQCGQVVGINTEGLAGLSLFIQADNAQILVPTFTDKDITKINVDPSKSPEGAVTAFYTYLKERRMQDGFNLLSSQYLQKTNFTEWTNRFSDILNVDVVKTEQYQNNKDTVFVKFWTENWNDNDLTFHYYEGTWKTIKEDGVYKMLEADIKEVSKPDWDWFYN